MDQAPNGSGESTSLLAERKSGGEAVPVAGISRDRAGRTLHNALLGILWRPLPVHPHVFASVGTLTLGQQGSPTELRALPSKGITPPTDGSFISSERSRMFTATLFFRVGVVAGIATTAGFRRSLPDWMIRWFLLIAAPLFIYNLAGFLCRKRLESILTQRPWLLMVDLLIAVAILSLGGGWRNSYFMYTLTTIILFTIFLKRQGSWSAAAVFIAAALLKHPGGRLPAVATFGATNWDMRLGAALFYLCAGLILGYFDTLLSRVDRLAKEKVIATQRQVAMEEKARLALGLHDGAKQMITALLLRSRALLRRQEWEETAVRRELELLWRGMSYLQTELTQLVKTLEAQEQPASLELADIAREEIQLVEALTGCCWTLVTSDEEKTSLSLRQRDALRPFLSEALMNTWKHAGVAAGTIELKRHHGEVIVIVADQGRGFDPTALVTQATLGLQSLRRRARELGGRLELVSRPGQGCRLTLTFPAHLPDG